MLNCTMIKTVRQSLNRFALLFLTISALTIASPSARACMSNSEALKAYNQAIATATNRYSAVQDQALLQLNVDRAQAKADFDSAIAQPGDDHSSDHYNEAITTLNHANAQAEAAYSETVVTAQTKCQQEYDGAALSYRHNKCF